MAFCFPGVAEQFALAEAAMSVWSMNDCMDQPSTSLQGVSAGTASLGRNVCRGRLSRTASAVVPLSMNAHRPTTQGQTAAESSCDPLVAVTYVSIRIQQELLFLNIRTKNISGLNIKKPNNDI